ncbi:MAG: ABC transporter ATP-binding protein [Granulosicoccus sp.]
MFELVDVSKKVGAEMHITDVSLQLDPGSLNVLLGPTLSGKTSLMRLMAGLDKPTRGDIRIKGESVLGMSVRKRSVAMVYQQFINYPALSVYENIASPMRIAGVDKSTLDKKVREAAELLKLSEFLERTPLNLSGGQQQRTALARALVKDAQLVLLDEPLANLDYKLREELRDELPKLFAKTGAVLVYATTEPQEALLLGGKTATMSEGRITQFGSTIDVYKQPGNLQTAQTFADPPLNTARVRKQSSNLLLGDHTLPCDLPSLADGEYIMAVRPHHIALQSESTQTSTVPAVVSSSEITGSETFIHIQADQENWVLLTHGVHRFDKGDDLLVHLDPSRFYIFNTDGVLVQSPIDKAQAA